MNIVLHVTNIHMWNLSGIVMIIIIIVNIIINIVWFETQH